MKDDEKEKSIGKRTAARNRQKKHRAEMSSEQRDRQLQINRETRKRQRELLTKRKKSNIKYYDRMRHRNLKVERNNVIIDELNERDARWADERSQVREQKTMFKEENPKYIAICKAESDLKTAEIILKRSEEPKERNETFHMLYEDHNSRFIYNECNEREVIEESEYWSLIKQFGINSENVIRILISRNRSEIWRREKELTQMRTEDG